MTTPKEVLNIKQSEKIRKEYIASFKKANKDKSNKLFAEQLTDDFSIRLNKLEKN